jgi:uncharacterized protein
MKINVRLQPKSSVNQVVGYANDVLKVKVTTPPANNKANEACVKVLSSFFKIPKSSISLISGGKNKDKVFDLQGLEKEHFQDKLTQLKKL